MLMIGAKDGQLKQWTVTDPQGYDTRSRSIIWIPPRSLTPACSRSTSPDTRCRRAELILYEAAKWPLLRMERVFPGLP